MTLLGWLTDAARGHAPELLLTLILATCAFAAFVRIIDPGDP
jgi:hypothetical protein